MSYVTPAQVQSWLQVDKFDILPAEGVNAELELLAADTVLSYLEKRYATSGWTSDLNTPSMVLRLIAMLVASFTLRKAISEDNGESLYSTWLEDRVLRLLEALVSGDIELPGVDPDPNSPGSASAEFFPTNAATQLWLDETGGDPFVKPVSDGAAARRFDSQMIF